MQSCCARKSDSRDITPNHRDESASQVSVADEVHVGSGPWASLVIFVMYGGMGLFGAFFCLEYQEDLRAAGRSANRWSGLP